MTSTTLSCRMKILPQNKAAIEKGVITEDEPFDLYDIELSDEDFAAE